MAQQSPSRSVGTKQTKIETEELGAGTSTAQHSPDRDLGPQKV